MLADVFCCWSDESKIAFCAVALTVTNPNDHTAFIVVYAFSGVRLKVEADQIDAIGTIKVN